jgi:NNP family nitrate/nitrite transporter-like MFS transporter
MVAYGWQTWRKSGRPPSRVMAVVFFLMTKDDPDLARRARRARSRSAGGSSRRSNVQVWRFSLYYFFVFGAFVALALWLPRYLIGVYGLDIATAGMVGAAYSIPASGFRAYGGHLSDRSARAGHVLDVPRLGGLHLHAVLSADAPTSSQASAGRSVHHADGPRRPFTVAIFVLGFFMSLGKAAVYKHIPVYYPTASARSAAGRHDRRPGRLRPADRLRRCSTT